MTGQVLARALPAPAGGGAGLASRSIARSLAAAALGAWGPVSAVWPATYRDHTGWLSLALTALAITVGWRIDPKRLGWVVVTVAAAAAATWWSLRLGRGPAAAVWLLVAGANAAVVGWPRWSRWRPAPDPSWLAIAMVGLGGWRWATHQDAVAVSMGMAALGLVVLGTVRPAGAERVDRSVRGGWRWVVATIGRPMGLVAAADFLRLERARLASWWRAPKDRRDRWFIGALGVGFAARTAWVVAMAQPHAEYYSWWNLILADQFAAGELPSYGGHATAYWPPAYPATLAPLAWAAQQWPWLPLHWTGAALNVLIGTATIALVASLAARWFGPSARNPAAWIMALAAGHVFASSALTGDLLATLLFVLAVLAATIVVDRGTGRPAAPFVVVGAIVGYATLIKDFGVLFAFIPALCIRARRGGWSGALRPTVATLLGALVLLGPWTVRNGVQVGVWRPFSTVNVENLCYAKWDIDWRTFLADGGLESASIASGGTEASSREILEDCNRNSPLDNPDLSYRYAVPRELFRYDRPDEATWVARESREVAEHFLGDPMQLLEVAPMRIYTTAGNDSIGGLALATQSGETTIAGPQAMEVFANLQTAWYYAVLVLVSIGLLRLGSVRAAIPLWAICVVLALYTIPGPRALSRHYYVAYPFLVAMAGATIAAIGASGRAAPSGPEGRSDAGVKPVERTDATSAG